jgi:hypothetical protein
MKFGENWVFLAIRGSLALARGTWSPASPLTSPLSSLPLEAGEIPGKGILGGFRTFARVVRPFAHVLPASKISVAAIFISFISPIPLGQSCSYFTHDPNPS